MRRGPVKVLVCVCVSWIGTAVPAPARELQEPVLPSRVIGTGSAESPLPDTTQWEPRLRELERWVADYGKWKQWEEQWRNTQEPGWLGARERRTRPDPPPWLAVECQDVILEDDGILAGACRILSEWNDEESVARLRQQRTAARAQREAPSHSAWWEHVHLDALWPMTQVGGGVFGVLGVHATLDVVGRLQIFVAPGAILLNVPTSGPSREWRPATDFGFAYRCFDFTLPVSGRRASLHFNFAKAWLLAGPSNVIKSSIDLAGFSVTLKKLPTK